MLIMDKSCVRIKNSYRIIISITLIFGLYANPLCGQQQWSDYVSHTLPILHINVYDDESHSSFDDEIIDPNLNHKIYFSYAEYWVESSSDPSLNVGSESNPLALQIKGRGNWTLRGFAKKPYKLKLDKKISLLGLSKSKHFVLLAHADDSYGYMRNFVGFNLGKRIGLPWTPSQQPVEVVINGDYRGLYFLTESIRVDSERINITEQDDYEEDPQLVSGGYVVEIDNYIEDNSIILQEKGCVDGYKYPLIITPSSPEYYSPIQGQFIEQQFNVSIMQ